ncbi:MAG: PAS domain-containing protein [Bryobacteraceae bacterium]|nr:PAS domain-containing protein [Bryobacteraceae bacterium]
MGNAVTDEDLCKLVVSSMPDGVVAADADGKVCFLNAQAELLLQWQLAAAAGQEIWKIITLFSLIDSKPIALLRDQERRDEPDYGDACLLNPLGAEIPVSYSVAAAAIGERLTLITLSPRHGSTQAAAGPGDPAPKGLPDRRMAEDTIRHAVEHDEAGYAVLFQVERMALYAQRYGTEAARDIKMRYAHYLGDGLKAAKNTFDWTASTFLLLARSGITENRLREQLNLATGRRMDVAIKESAAILSVTARWELLPLAGDASADDLIAQLDFRAAGRR